MAVKDSGEAAELAERLVEEAQEKIAEANAAQAVASAEYQSALAQAEAAAAPAQAVADAAIGEAIKLEQEAAELEAVAEELEEIEREELWNKMTETLAELVGKIGQMESRLTAMEETNSQLTARVKSLQDWRESAESEANSKSAPSNSSPDTLPTPLPNSEPLPPVVAETNANAEPPEKRPVRRFRLL